MPLLPSNECVKGSNPTPPPFKLASFEPLEKLQIDTIGPFDHDDGNKYVIVIVDYFSR